MRKHQASVLGLPACLPRAPMAAGAPRAARAERGRGRPPEGVGASPGARAPSEATSGRPSGPRRAALAGRTRIEAREGPAIEAYDGIGRIRLTSLRHRTLVSPPPTFNHLDWVFDLGARVDAACEARSEVAQRPHDVEEQTTTDRLVRKYRWGTCGSQRPSRRRRDTRSRRPARRHCRPW